MLFQLGFKRNSLVRKSALTRKKVTFGSVESEIEIKIFFEVCNKIFVKAYCIV